eukprot:7124586-Prorocentrum_lima.AAC.1
MGRTAEAGAATAPTELAPAGASTSGACAGIGSPEEAATPGEYPLSLPFRFQGSTSVGRATRAAN